MATRLLPLLVFGDYSRSSRAANAKAPIESWAKFKLIRAFMVDFNTCKNEEDPIKNESPRVITTLNIEFQMLTAANYIVDRWDLIQTHPTINGCPCYLQE